MNTLIVVETDVRFPLDCRASIVGIPSPEAAAAGLGLLTENVHARVWRNPNRNFNSQSCENDLLFRLWYAMTPPGTR